MLWDIFCRVIDNYGDIGVCWRLGAELARRGQHVRLWVDDASALAWMAPGATQGQWPGVQVCDWQHASQATVLSALPRADVWVEAFGCDIPLPFVAHGVQQTHAAGGPQPVWLNLEYLSAEPYVERSHGLQSPLLNGPAAGWRKTFCYPGFSLRTAGLLRDGGPAQAIAQPLDAATRAQRFRRLGVDWQGECVVLLFCYEPPLLADLLAQWAASATPLRVLVCSGRATVAVQALLGTRARHGALQVHYLAPLCQRDFDALLDACDLNLVRGEDSLARALWAGKPFVWHIYPQQDLAHAPKLEAFLEVLQCDPAVRRLHRAWNGLGDPAAAVDALQLLQPAHLPAWQLQVQEARQRLLELHELADWLVQFAAKNR